MPKCRPISKQKKRGPAVKATFFIAEKGITHIELAPTSPEIGFAWEAVEIVPSELVVKLIERWVDSYCRRRQPDVVLPLAMPALPPYATQVLSILREVPFGVHLSYSELAEITGNPHGARAVGNACARNPCPLVIPCHRVLAAGGKLGGFSAGGLAVKRALLDFEA